MGYKFSHSQNFRSNFKNKEEKSLLVMGIIRVNRNVSVCRSIEFTEYFIYILVREDWFYDSANGFSFTCLIISKDSFFLLS